jgi:hypothetical protein
MHFLLRVQGLRHVAKTSARTLLRLLFLREREMSAGSAPAALLQLTVMAPDEDCGHTTDAQRAKALNLLGTSAPIELAHSMAAAW